MPEQILGSALSFYGDSLRRMKDQVRSERTKLVELWEAVPDSEALFRPPALEESRKNTHAIIQDMIDYYTPIEDSLDQAIQDLVWKVR
jgi:hypothetical protein